MIDAVLSGQAEYAVLQGDSLATLRTLPADTFHVAMCSPPYFALRDYGTGRWEGGEAGCDHKGGRTSKSPTLEGGNQQREVEGIYRFVCGKCGARRIDEQIGLEASVEDYLRRLVAVFGEVRRVLRPDGILCVNMGDSYAGGGPHHGENNKGKSQTNRGSATGQDRFPAGYEPGDLLGVPWRLALALQSDGWLWRATIVWRKLSPMPASLNGWRWERCRVKVKAGTMRRADATRHRPKLPVNGQGYNWEAGAGATAEWSPCPGCDRCRDNDGLVLRRGSWRPTPSWEPVFLFSRGMGYFSDGEAVKQAGKNPDDDLRRINADRKKKYSQEWQDARPQGAMQGPPIDEAPAGANLRDFWDLPDVMELGPEPLSASHYAAYPTALPARVLAFATSQRGVCAVCGAPWARVVERKFYGDCRRGRRDLDGVEGKNEWRGTGAVEDYESPQTLGWRPTCEHRDAGVLGALVLDPFCGTSSTGVAARRLGLRYVGIDLSSEYVEISKRRLAGALSEGPRKVQADCPLFDSLEDT